MWIASSPCVVPEPVEGRNDVIIKKHQIFSDKNNMSNKMKKKIAEKAAQTKTIKLVISIVVGLMVVAFGITATVSFVNKKKADKTVRVAFYGLSEEFCNILKEKLPQEEGINLVCDVLSDGAVDLASIKQKYDLLFTWKGEVTDALEDSSAEIPQKILEVLPSSLKNKKCVPIFLDHFELAYNKTVVENTTQNIPNSFPAFLSFLSQAKTQVFSPFFCAGADARTIAAFVGAIIEAIGGVKSYNLFIDELKNGTPFEELLDKELGIEGFTLRSVLDSLKAWPKEGYTHPAWFNGTDNDLVYFASDNQVAVFFTTLQKHRKIEYNVISRFESYVMAPSSSTIEFGIIAPSVCGMLISENSNAKRYLAEFFTEEAQAEISDKTRLAPVHLRAQAYDRQADDVRFFAASCPAGALPDVYLAAFQRNQAGFTEFAGQIRNYLR